MRIGAIFPLAWSEGGGGGTHWCFAQDDESVWEVVWGGGGGGYESGGRPVWDGAVKKCRGGVWEVQGKRGKEEEGREGGKGPDAKKGEGKRSKNKIG